MCVVNDQVTLHYLKSTPEISIQLGHFNSNISPQIYIAVRWGNRVLLFPSLSFGPDLAAEGLRQPSCWTLN